jgi:hypothetical protein
MMAKQPTATTTKRANPGGTVAYCRKPVGLYVYLYSELYSVQYLETAPQEHKMEVGDFVSREH